MVITPEVRFRLPRYLSCVSFQIICLLLMILYVPLSAKAESGGQKPGKPYALVYGTVWGPDDRPLYGVPIRIQRSTGKKAHWQLSSDHSGEFAQRVPAGKADYNVTADLKGFKSKDGKHLRLDKPVTVHIENDERTDIGLHLTE